MKVASMTFCASPLRASSHAFRFQTGGGGSDRGLLPSALIRQSLHEAAGHRRDDDNAHEQSRGDSDHQGDEEEVGSWRERK